MLGKGSHYCTACFHHIILAIITIISREPAPKSTPIIATHTACSYLGITLEYSLILHFYPAVNCINQRGSVSS